MEANYRLSLMMKTPSGTQEYGSFAIGNDAQYARDLFRAIVGGLKVSSASIITIDLVKIENEIPITLAIRHCSYEQLAENAKLITKELFKKYTLEA